MIPACNVLKCYMGIQMCYVWTKKIDFISSQSIFPATCAKLCLIWHVGSHGDALSLFQVHSIICIRYCHITRISLSRCLEAAPTTINALHHIYAYCCFLDSKIQLTILCLCPWKWIQNMSIVFYSWRTTYNFSLSF
jgi:hypothetical protein